MRLFRFIALLAVATTFSASGHAKDPADIVRKAVARSTLNQPGTKPFHLKALLAPSKDSDRESNRSGEVEIWWASPSQWRREVRSPQFHQVAIVNHERQCVQSWLWL